MTEPLPTVRADVLPRHDGRWLVVVKETQTGDPYSWYVVYDVWNGRICHTRWGAERVARRLVARRQEENRMAARAAFSVQVLEDGSTTRRELER